jgi:hypothetical protein
VRETEVNMRTRLRLLHSWQHQLAAITVGVRVTQANALATLAFGMLLAGSVVLPRAAAAVPGQACVESVSRRFRRFLSNRTVEVATLWSPMRRALLAPFAGQEVTLVFDPTPFGAYATVLVLSVVVHRRALPIAWRVVAQQDRWPGTLDALLAPMLAAIAADLPAGSRVTLLADRGITGPTVLRLCAARGWQYTLRLNVGPGQTNRIRVDGREAELWTWLQARGFAWTGPVSLFKDAGWLAVELTVRWDRRYKEPWILVSDRPAGHARVVEYRRRTRVEAAYQDAKSRGFDLERSKLRAHDRIERLWMALALALWWSTQAGLRTIRTGQRQRFDRRGRRDWSVMRLGRQAIDRALLSDRVPPLPFRWRTDHWAFTRYA